MNRFRVLLLGMVAYVALTGQAFAYVDPGSGSIIITTILGLIAAVGYTMRKYFYKLRAAFRSKKEDGK